jgi:hypothetical protein
MGSSVFITQQTKRLSRNEVGLKMCCESNPALAEPRAGLYSFRLLRRLVEMVSSRATINSNHDLRTSVTKYF